jgi:hypothetical protein
MDNVDMTKYRIIRKYVTIPFGLEKVLEIPSR